MNWIKNGTTLFGDLVTLLPMQTEHFPGLCEISRDQRIWEHKVQDMSDDLKCAHVFSAMLVEREKGNQFPFVISHNATGRLIGSTRYMDIHPNIGNSR